MTASFPVSSPGSDRLLGRSTPARRLLLGGALLVQAASAPGCEPEPKKPATAVAVLVKTEISSEDLAHVEFRINGVGEDPDYIDAGAKFTSPVEELKSPFIVTRGHADKFLLSVLGFARGGRDAVIVYRELVTFQEGKTLALPVFLADACYAKRCSIDGLTCYGASYDGTPPGQCAAYPERQLQPVLVPGDESKWEPVRTKRSVMDAGFRPSNPFDPDDDYYDDDDEAHPGPTFDGGLSFPGCSTQSASRSCSPGTLALDASFPPLLDRQ